MNAGAQQERVGYRFLFSRRWLGFLTLFVLFSVACAWFGNWQFDRRAEARAEIARIDANYDAAPTELTQVVPEPQSFDEDSLKWQPVTVHGTYVGETYLARNRPGPEGVGSQLIQPLRLDDGSLFIVDRGWVPITASKNLEAASLPKPTEGRVSVEARLRASEPSIAGRSASGNTIPSIDLLLLEEMLSDDLRSSDNDTTRMYTGAYGQLISETPPAEHGMLAPRPERDEGPHLSYALQWYVFIIIVFAGMVYGARQEWRSLNETHPSDAEASRGGDPPRNRRRLSDAEIEDAILDNA